MIKGCDLALHLAKYFEPCDPENDDESLSTLFLINEKQIDVVKCPR